ncbi:MAG TPA: type II toxin-antitoxin system VapC family toxin [Niabella sp.]|nr:type II toxin-antitoxin system VapC family toxin [Niabella sp.]
MTGNKILLDTTVVIELFKGNATVLANLKGTEFVNISSIVLGELLLGAYRSSNAKKHLAQINSFLQKSHVLPATAEVASMYAVIKSNLLNKGRPIPENDIWIAATALQQGLTLLTTDKHFGEIENLDIRSL